ncbi:MAG: zinc ABC transporter substrate-binding protein [Rhodobacter sp.]|nr:zinc ABC transporter substrate-binding protein [Rhodobacter sp.]
MSTKLLPVSLSAALLGGTAMADVPSVAVDIAPVHSLVARVMAGVGSPDLIVPPGASPHEYSLRPSEAEALQNADVVFWMGEDLAPWMEDAVETLATDAAVTTLLEIDETSLLEFREGALFEAHDHGDEDHGDHDEDEHGHDEHAEDSHGAEDHAEGEDGHDEHAEKDHGHDDHAEDEHGHEEHAEDEHGHEEHAEDEHGHEGHDHGAHDPHAWLSPDNASAWLNVIAAELSATDPDNAGAYFANAAAGRAEIDAVKTEISATLDPARGKSFVVFHDAYQYFETAFDIPASGAISLGDATDPSPARIAEIQERVRDEGIDCVLSEPQYNPGLVAVVLDGTEAKTGVLDPLGSDLEPGPGMYPQLLRNLAGVLAGCL